VTEIAGQCADLTSVVRIVLQQIGDHVQYAPGHALHAHLADGDRRLEQTREFVCGLPEGSARLRRRRTSAIERWRAWPRAAQARSLRRTPTMCAMMAAIDRPRPFGGGVRHSAVGRTLTRYSFTRPLCLNASRSSTSRSSGRPLAMSLFSLPDVVLTPRATHHDTKGSRRGAIRETRAQIRFTATCTHFSLVAVYLS
jgi:hypothetical protein